MEVERAADALELLQALRMEADDNMEVWYLTCCAMLQGDEPALAVEEEAVPLEDSSVMRYLCAAGCVASDARDVPVM